MRRVYLTTPLYYVNAEPHLGHTYTTVIADTLARWHRERGDATLFVTGTDEHGDKIAQAAAAAGATPQAHADRVSRLFRDTWDACGIRYDHFIRTTDEYHVRTVQELLRRIEAAGDIYFGGYGGLYCYGCERFYTEKELVDGVCPDHRRRADVHRGRELLLSHEPLSASALIDDLEAHPERVQPDRYRNEVLAMLRGEALGDLCISRPKARLDWGITLPFDDRYVAYVWFDALTNYVSALRQLGRTSSTQYLAARRALHRQGHSQSARRLLADHVVGGRAAALPLLARARLLDPRREQDVEEPRQRHSSARDEAALRHGRLSLLPAARDGVRPGRDVQRGRLRDARQCRSRQRHRQSGEPHARHAAALLRRRRAATRRVDRRTASWRRRLLPPAATPAITEQLAFHRALEALWRAIDQANKYITETAPFTLAKDSAPAAARRCHPARAVRGAAHHRAARRASASRHGAAS